MVSFILLIYVFIFVMCPVMLIRNMLIFKYIYRALDIIKPKAMKLVDEGTDWEYLYVRLDNISYSKKLFQFSKWAFEDFYPDINEW